MNKPIYKLLDENGRVLIPKELRSKAEMECGDILKLSVKGGVLTVVKVDIVEIGSQNPEAVEAYIHAAIKTMPYEKQVATASKILKIAEQR